jgi:hypothetical protein
VRRVARMRPRTSRVPDPGHSQRDFRRRQPGLEDHGQPSDPAGSQFDPDVVEAFCSSRSTTAHLRAVA